MRLLVTNLSASASVDLPAPFSVTLAPLGTKTLGVHPEDFLSGDSTGNPLWKQWDVLLKNGSISAAPLADTGVTNLSIMSIVGNNIVNDDLTVVGNGLVGGTLGVTGASTLAALAATSGAFSADVSALGGFRQTVGPFTAPGAAGVIAAAQANLDCRYEHTVTAVVSGFVAKRAGSIMGLSAQISAAITGAGESMAVKVTVNGAEVGAALDLAFTQAGAEVTDFAVAAKDAVAFVAGDVIGVSYTSTAGVTNTPALVASIEIEC